MIHKSITERFEEKVLKMPMTDCHLWISDVNNCGYGRFSIHGKTQKAHRVAYELYVGPVGECHVLHNCDNPICVNPAHLRLGTHSENMKDMAKRTRYKATPKVVAEIREDIKNGVSYSKIAAKHGITTSYVGRIKLNQARSLV